MFTACSISSSGQKIKLTIKLSCGNFCVCVVPVSGLVYFFLFQPRLKLLPSLTMQFSFCSFHTNQKHKMYHFKFRRGDSHHTHTHTLDVSHGKCSTVSLCCVVTVTGGENSDRLALHERRV